MANQLNYQQLTALLYEAIGQKHQCSQPSRGPAVRPGQGTGQTPRCPLVPGILPCTAIRPVGTRRRTDWTLGNTEKHHRSTRRVNFTYDTLQHGISDAKETKPSLAPILDAFASMLVSGETKQVVAIALQIRPETQQIQLTINKNHRVHKGLITHLTSILKNLKALSDVHAEAETWESGEEQKHHTKGSHRKSHLTWGMPTIDEKTIGKLTVREFLEHYTAHLRITGKLLAMSESTPPTTPTAYLQHASERYIEEQEQMMQLLQNIELLGGKEKYFYNV
ncbi:hypothetical protein HOY80DRAFT_1057199 [Tuber brumale]|nr:hypothetical protein HOY80DRAFT_1057199 [Tuber brumale]